MSYHGIKWQYINVLEEVMRFRIYDINKVVGQSTEKMEIKDVQQLFSMLNKFPRVEEGTVSYAPLYMKSYKQFLLGTLAQSYFTQLTKFDEKNHESKQEIELPDNIINDKTLFYINVEESQIYIQSKRYPSPTLSNNLTIERLENILQACLKTILVLTPAKIDYNIEELEEIFQRSYVDKIVFKNFNGIKIPEGSLIHNPRADLDKAAVESWNCYSKNDLDYMELHSMKGKKLTKNPLARTGMLLAKLRDNKSDEGKNILTSIEIIDNDERVKITPTGNDSKIIYISKKFKKILMNHTIEF